ncbi:MAG: adenylate/guanylate cyclase domain-containing protein [Sedimentisphaerales bacterium]|nr:adenylate/guanylate cyclase domain-containing protein [Sedimentisphaerales bacterium]
MSKTCLKCLRGIAIGLVASVTALLVWRLGWLESWEAPTWTWRARFFSQREELSPQVKLILLDQASLDWALKENAWGWPWPREVYGAISAFCTRGGAKVLSFDLLYTEPSVFGVSDDEAMGQALSEGVPTILAVQPGGSRETWPEYMPRPVLKINQPPGTDATHLLFPVREVAVGAKAAGHVKGVPDRDGVFRRVSPFCRFDDVDIPALGLSAWLTDQNAVEIKAIPGQLHLDDKTIPLDRNDHAILRFKGKGDVSEAVSAAAVIQSEIRLRSEETPTISPEIFKDCYVFVGCSAPALLDLRPIPINPKCPGVVLHATFVDNLVTDSFIAESALSWVILGVMATTIAAALSLTYGGRWFQAGPLSVVWLGIPVLVGFVAYAKGYWWPVVAQEVGAGLALVGALVVNYWVEGRQKAFIKQAFRHYLSGEVIEKIILDPKHLQLGGEKRELTILFTDLAGFSTFSERLGPVELTALLNDYLSEMTDIILAEGGTLDKYEGDAIIAFWNAPLEQPDHAVRACRAILRCQRRLAELRDEYVKRTGAELHMRAGLNTGDVVVGNMGSRKRFNYTILGDAANLASRLEGANKAFGTKVMISESTWSKVSNSFCGRKLADLRVVGRKTAVAVYELTGFEGETAAPGWEQFADGLARFSAGDFEGAKNVFSQLPDDPAAQRYAHRCEQFIAHPPDSWNGVWELTEK